MCAFLGTEAASFQYPSVSNDEESRKVFLACLPWHTQEDDIRRALQFCGEVR
jgi:hypothetical protein